MVFNRSESVHDNIQSLQQKYQFICGCPGRLNNLIKARKIKIKDVNMIILENEKEIYNSNSMRNQFRELMDCFKKDNCKPRIKAKNIDIDREAAIQIVKGFKNNITKQFSIHKVFSKINILVDRYDCNIMIFCPTIDEVNAVRQHLNKPRYKFVIIFCSKLEAKKKDKKMLI